MALKPQLMASVTENSTSILPSDASIDSMSNTASKTVCKEATPL